MVFYYFADEKYAFCAHSDLFNLERIDLYYENRILKLKVISENKIHS